MKELETLLNSLLQRGRKPFSYLGNVERIEVDGDFDIAVIFSTGEFIYNTLRDLVVLESGLWQFVLENRMVKENDDVRIKNYRGDNECDTNCCYDDYEYRLLESALIPEEGLGKFLVDNIVVEGKKE